MKLCVWGYRLIRKIHIPKMVKPSVYISRPESFYPFLRTLLEDRFHIEFTDKMGTTTEQLLEKIKGKFGLICSSSQPNYDPIVNEKVYEASGGTLKVVCVTSVGLETINVASLKSCGVKISNPASLGTESAAEMAMALLLCVARRINEFGKQSRRVTPHRLHYMTRGVKNSTVGILGCGRIGASIARKLKAFEPQRILYFARSEKPEVNALGGEFKSLEELIKESDYIIVTLALNKETENIINKEVISWMKPSSVFINIGRGALVDTEALTEALTHKKIKAAAVDVTNPEPLPIDHPLLKLENVLITPHIGGETYEFMMSSSQMVANNLISAWEGKPLIFEL